MTIIQQNSTSSEKRQPEKTEMARLLSAVWKYAGEQESLALEEIPDTLTKNLGIDWRDFVENDSPEAFSEWLFGNFPVEADPDRPGKLRLRYKTKREYAAALLREEIEASPTRSYLLSDVPDLWENRGYSWRDEADGTPLGAWVKEGFPEFERSADGYSFILKGEQKQEKKTGAEPLRADSDEVSQMHAFAFMNWWSSNVKILRQYTGSDNNDEHEWREIIAHRMAKIFLGGEDRFLDASGDEEPRLAFDTGLKAANGRTLYCVLGRNIRRSGPQGQRWAMQGFCYPGEVNENGLGEWLCRRFSIPTESQRNLKDDYQKLEQVLTGLEMRQQSLLEQMESALADLREGAPLSSDKLSGGIAAYRKDWAKLESLLDNMPRLERETAWTLPQLRQQIDEGNNESEHLNSAVELFDEIVEKTRALFRQRDIPEENFAQAAADQEQIHEMYYGGQGGSSLDTFLRVLDHYKCLLRMLSAQEWSQELIGDIKQISDYFSLSNPMSNRLLFLPENERAYLGMIANVEQLLQQSVSVLRSAEEPVSAEQLLKEATGEMGFTSECWNLRAPEVFPRDALERLLVLNELSRAKELLQSAELLPGYSQEERAAFLGQLEQTCQTPEYLSPYAAARRLLHVVGNRHQTAEKYLLLGLGLDKTRCAAELFNLYRREERQDAFTTLWECCGDIAPKREMENQLHYLELLCGRSFEEAMRYANAHSHLLHQKESLALLVQAARRAGEQTLADNLQTRLEKLRLQPAPNAFERLLIEDQAVTAWLDNPDALVQLGYSEIEIERIHQAAVTADYPTGLNDHAVGRRILAFQGNKNGIAEYYLWRGLAVEDECAALVRLLAAEQRWEECRQLYECHAADLESDSDCRQAYLTALLRFDSVKAMSFIRVHLQDGLLLAHGNTAARAVMESQKKESEDKLGDLYGQLLLMSEHLHNELTSSVVLLDHNLRELVTRRDKLAECGLEGPQIENMIVTFTAREYPREMDAVSVAERVFRFMGVANGTAEAFARFALPAPEAAELLWNIYEILQNSQEQNELLRDYPALREPHWKAYCDYLFREERYEQFLKEAQKYEEPTLVVRLQMAIAHLRLRGDEDCILPAFSGYLEDVPAELMVLLFKTLAETGRKENLEAVLFACFEELLVTYPQEQVDRILMADGALTIAQLEMIQADALANRRERLAIYYHNALQVGDLGDLPQRFYQDTMRQCEMESLSEQLAMLQSLSRLYRDQKGALGGGIVLLRVRKLLENGTDNEETARQIGGLLSDCTLERAEMGRLMEVLEDSKLCSRYPVYTAVTRLCESAEMKVECLRYFHAAALQPENREKGQFLSFLCGLYQDAILAECFPEEIYREAEEFCLWLVREKRDNTAVFCLFHIETRLGRGHQASYALRFLRVQPADTLSEAPRKFIEEAVSAQWKERVPSVFELFRDALAKLSMEEIRAYCGYCDHFVEPNPGDLVLPDSDSIKDGFLSEDECALVLERLFALPEDLELWKECEKFPLQDNPVAYAKLLYLRGETVPAFWESCVIHCGEYQRNFQQIRDLLLPALVNWTNATRPGKLWLCRNYLEEQIEEELAADQAEDEAGKTSEKTENQGYFQSLWKDSPLLIELVRVHCVKFRQEKHTSADAIHAALRGLSIIAVETKKPEALEIFYNDTKEYLLGAERDLGFAVVCRLLLERRAGEAYGMLQELGQLASPMKYQKLVRELAALPKEELRRWTESSRENQKLLELILPDGNVPNLKRIQPYVIDSILAGETEGAIDVFRRLLADQPEDYACHNALFTLCKQDFQRHLSLIHQSLCGLVRTTPGNRSESYYRHSRVGNAVLLAVANAVVIALELQDTVAGGYNFFGEKAGDYYQNYAGISNEEAKAINDVQDNIGKRLAYLHREERERLCDAFLSYITGDWTGFLSRAWTQRRTLREQELRLYDQKLREILNEKIEYRGKTGLYQYVRNDERPRGGGKPQYLEEHGLARSILRCAEELPGEERKGFLRWLAELLGLELAEGLEERNDFKYWMAEFKVKQLHIALEISKKHLPALALSEEERRKILKYPFEDYSLKDIHHRRLIEPLLQGAPEHLYEYAFLMGALTNYSMAQAILWKNANKAFEGGRDQVAMQMFQALLELARGHGIEKVSFKGGDSSRYSEQCEVYYRLSALFSGDEEVCQMVASPGFRSWSCMNLVLGLICKKERVGELGRLLSFFAPENVRVAETVLTGLDPTVPDTAKLEAVKGIEDEVARAMLCYLVKYEMKEMALFLRGREALDEMYRICRDIARRNPREFKEDVRTGWIRPRPFILVPDPKDIAVGAFSQRKAEDWQIFAPQTAGTGQEEGLPAPAEAQEDIRTPTAPPEEEQQAPAEYGRLQESHYRTPRFAEELTPLDEGADVDLEQFMREYDDIAQTSMREEKLRRSERLYRAALAKELPRANLVDILLCFGVEYYYFYAIQEGGMPKANQAIKELALVWKFADKSGKGKRTFANTVNQTALQGLFMEYSSIREMVNDYDRNRTSFQRLWELITNQNIADSVSKIYSALENLTECYSHMTSFKTDELRKELNSGYRVLNGIKNIGQWLEVRSHLLKLVMDEINEINMRPQLRIEVLNEGDNPVKGFLFGQVENIGAVPAENIILQATYGDGSQSRQYEMKRLDRGTRVTFQIDYGMEPGATLLKYTLQAAYTYRRDPNSQTPSRLETIVENKLTLAEIQEPVYYTDEYDTQTTATFVIENGMENGDPDTIRITGKKFFGRQQEMQQLRRLYTREDVEGFVDYRNAVVRGIRRAGKTSLLNYLMTYAKARCMDAVAVFVDCQGKKLVRDEEDASEAVKSHPTAINGIYEVFVKPVLEKVRPLIGENEEWEKLFQKWELAPDAPDCNPNHLKYFYSDVRRVLGKGIIMVIDEVDKLFAYSREREGEDYRLLPALGELISGGVEWRECVHFVLCGSNHLITYQMDGGAISQLFQRFGTNVIEVGELPEKDMREMLLKPYEGNPPKVKYTEAALEWIWMYTGGLVWYSKLLGQYSLEEAKRNWRSVVYPNDVQAAIHRVVNMGNCQQFYEGCDNDCRTVLDAMQYLAPQPKVDIPLERIRSQVDGKVTNLESSLMRLVQLKLVELVEGPQSYYRFTKDIYRCYFRIDPMRKFQSENVPQTFHEKEADRRKKRSKFAEDDES